MRMPKTASIADRAFQHSDESIIVARAARYLTPDVLHWYLHDPLDNLERSDFVNHAKRSFLVAMMMIHRCIQRMVQSRSGHHMHGGRRRNMYTFQGQSMNSPAVSPPLEKS
jgi:hypothetical protein